MGSFSAELQFQSVPALILCVGLGQGEAGQTGPQGQADPWPAEWQIANYWLKGVAVVPCLLGHHPYVYVS